MVVEPYRLRRVAERGGVGPFEVYRTTNRLQQDLRQTPRRWVTTLPAWGALAGDPAPKIASRLWMAGVTSAIKVWSELAYEHVRIELVPDAVSRFEAVFCSLDLLEAFAFNEDTDHPTHVWRGGVEPGVPWTIVDMAGFDISPIETSEDGFRRAWDRYCDSARLYWTPGADIARPEVLVGGAVNLVGTPLTLIESLIERGLLQR